MLSFPWALNSLTHHYFHYSLLHPKARSGTRSPTNSDGNRSSGWKISRKGQTCRQALVRRDSPYLCNILIPMFSPLGHSGYYYMDSTRLLILRKEANKPRPDRHPRRSRVSRLEWGVGLRMSAGWLTARQQHPWSVDENKVMVFPRSSLARLQLDTGAELRLGALDVIRCIRICPQSVWFSRGGLVKINHVNQLQWWNAYFKPVFSQACCHC